jgi:hypothetical protein
LVRACATRNGFCGVALVLLFATSAFGAEAPVNGASEFLLLVQIQGKRQLEDDRGTYYLLPTFFSIRPRTPGPNDGHVSAD